MIGRRNAPDSAVTAVAQRRLAALARQLERTRTGSSIETDEIALLAPEGDRAPADPNEAQELPPPGRGRHARTDGTRWRLTPQQVALVALLALAAVVLAAWWVVQSVPQPEPVQLSSDRPPAPVTSTDPGAPPAPTPTGGAPDSSDAAAASVVVDVAGKVRRPGIVELAAGARVVDALDAAGGVRGRVDTSSLNLARVVVDGEQIFVGPIAPSVPAGSVAPPTAGSTAPAPSSINLNLATQVELETLPGIGPVTAAAILAWRTENGSFTNVEELLEVSGIGDVTLAEIAPFVYV